MKTYRLLSIPMTAASILCLGSCSNQKDGEMIEVAPYLYEATYKEEFDWEGSKDFIIKEFGCSGVQNGDIRGRNYDWFYSDAPICIVRSEKTKDRKHTSIGVSDISQTYGEDGKMHENIIPFAIVDGINDAGMITQVNVLPATGEDSYHTETKDDDFPGSHVNRYILDYCSNIEDVINAFKDKDLYVDINDFYGLHWMVSGPTSPIDKTIKTIVIEWGENGFVLIDEFIDDKPIMTNFSVADFDGTPESTGVGAGWERNQILSDSFDQGIDVLGMLDLMKKTNYTNLYDLYKDGFWYSEYNGEDLNDYYEKDALIALIGQETYDYYMDNYGGVFYNSSFWDGESNLKGDIARGGLAAPLIAEDAEYYQRQDKEDMSIWITVHTSVYDSKNQTLDLRLREGIDTRHYSL
ncbi:MAG: carcinine hydrolase/isopenicillin-N N-acyltransferase family protein [Bacilli bacterium]|nr:carcinine hydrolase/isopenicillin-N N-acyltransferase family protein [Bacilli bacterium]